MNIKTLKQIITVEQIISILQNLGVESKQTSNLNQIQFRTICHCGNSFKLYFFKDTKEFHCYSNCGQMDIINLVQRVKGFEEVSKAVNWICNFLGIGEGTMIEGFFNETPQTLDLEILSRYNSTNEEVTIDMSREFKYIDEVILDRFYKYYHPAFYNDGIDLKTMFKFGIRYDILNERIIIPHRDELGGLIAIRCRNLNKELIESGLKYMPITIDKKLLSAKTNHYLYGQFYNQENIKKFKKVILVESEKAVMQLETILQGNNIGLALMSSSLSLVQVELLKELGVEEVIVALDKEFEEYGSMEEKAYATKIRKGIINKLLPYFTVSVMWDTNGYLGYKDSPTDKGSEVFFKLYAERIRVQ